jgi:hypothetical protein
MVQSGTLPVSRTQSTVNCLYGKCAGERFKVSATEKNAAPYVTICDHTASHYLYRDRQDIYALARL